MRFAALSLRHCVFFAFGAAVLGIGISAGIEWWGITYVRNAIVGFEHSDVALAEAADQMHDNLLQLRRYEKDVFINVASAEARDKYRTQWDAAFLKLRFDLTRVRSLAPRSMDEPVQEFVESIARYRSGFIHTYDLINEGAVGSAQQANDQIAEAKVAAHAAERQLVEIGQLARVSIGQLSDPVSFGRWASLALNLGLLVTVVGPLAYAMRRSALSQAA